MNESKHNPRLVVTQFEGCAPLVKAFNEGKDETVTWEDINVLPGGLKSPKPPGDKDVLRILRETEGSAVAVGSEESIEAAALLTRTEGIFPCPESATTLAGLLRALEDGSVKKNERIVLMITGSGLKSIPNFAKPNLIPIEAGTDVPAN